ncbi:MAG TPA: LmeA family phospholipid-binding protein [Fimbriimonas sp.]
MNVLLLGLFGGLFLFGGSQVRRFESEAAKEIASKLSGPEKRVSVKVRPAGLSGALASATIQASRFETEGLPLFTEPDRSTRGVVHELRIRLSDFSLRGLRIEQLSATIPDCRFDYALAVRRHQIRLSRSGVGQGTVSLLAEDLERYVLRKFSEIKRVEIEISGGRLRVSGYGEFLIVSTNFDVDATLRAVEGTRFVLEDAKVRFDGREAEPLARDALLGTLNPIVDLDQDLELHGAILVDRIVLEEGRIVASGTTRIPIKP